MLNPLVWLCRRATTSGVKRQDVKDTYKGTTSLHRMELDTTKILRQKRHDQRLYVSTGQFLLHRMELGSFFLRDVARGGDTQKTFFGILPLER